MPKLPPNGPVSLPAASYGYTQLKTSLDNALLAPDDDTRYAQVQTAIAASQVLPGVVVPVPTATLSSALVKTEGNSGTTVFSWTLTLNRDGSTAAYPYSWAIAGSGANPADANDFGGLFPTGTGTFAAGETIKTIPVLVTGDTAFEPDDTFTLAVSITGVASLTSTGTISNDDAAPALPTVTLSGAQSKSEGNSGASLYTYTVTRSITTGAVNVPWSFAAGSTSADDFTGGAYPAGGTVAIADGAATGTFTVSVNGDTAVEPDESFTVSIAAPSGYTAGTSVSATGTIVNDDVSPGTTSLRSAAVGGSMPEGATGVTAGITRVVHRAIFIPQMAAGSTAPIRFALPYFSVPDSSGETVWMPQAGTTLSAQVEYQTTSSFAACLSNLAVFDAKGYVWTDYVTPAQLGLASWPVDARTLFLKWEWVFPSTGTNRIFTADSSGGTTGSSGEGTGYGGNTTMGVYGAATGGGGSSQATRIARPWLIVADHGKTAIAGAGHSMMFGQADSGPGTVGQDITNSKAGGYWGRSTVRGQIPTTKMGKPADRIQYWAGFTNTANGDGTYTSTAADWNASALRREAIGLYHQWAVFDQGFNDISTVDAQIVFAQLKALYQKLKGDYPTLKIAQFEQSIRVSSASGNWDSAADQGPQTNYTDLATSSRSILNGLIRGAVGTLINRSINNVPLYNDPSKTDVWFSDGTAKKATIDGTHLRPYSQDLVATNLVNNHFPYMT